MFYEQDWILRQISIIIKFIRSLLSKERNVYEQDEEQTVLKEEIEKLIELNRLKEANSLIVKTSKDKDVLALGLWFYDLLNDFSDKRLEDGDLAREDILKGLRTLLYYSDRVDNSVVDIIIDRYWIYILYYKEMPTKPVFPYILKSQGGSILSTDRLIGFILNNSVTKKKICF